MKVLFDHIGGLGKVETDTIYTIILDDSGEMWQFTHKDLRACKNITFQRI
jgi:hypothetical protein